MRELVREAYHQLGSEDAVEIVEGESVTFYKRGVFLAPESGSREVYKYFPMPKNVRQFRYARCLVEFTVTPAAMDDDERAVQLFCLTRAHRSGSIIGQIVVHPKANEGDLVHSLLVKGKHSDGEREPKRLILRQPVWMTPGRPYDVRFAFDVKRGLGRGTLWEQGGREPITTWEVRPMSRKSELSILSSAVTIGGSADRFAAAYGWRFEDLVLQFRAKSEKD